MFRSPAVFFLLFFCFVFCINFLRDNVGLGRIIMFSLYFMLILRKGKKKERKREGEREKRRKKVCRPNSSQGEKKKKE